MESKYFIFDDKVNIFEELEKEWHQYLLEEVELNKYIYEKMQNREFGSLKIIDKFCKKCSFPYKNGICENCGADNGKIEIELI